LIGAEQIFSEHTTNLDEDNSSLLYIHQVDSVHTYNKEEFHLADVDPIITDEGKNLQSENKNQTLMQSEGLEVFSCQSLDHIIELVSTMRKDILLHRNSPHMSDFTLATSCRIHPHNPHS